MARDSLVAGFSSAIRVKMSVHVEGNQRGCYNRIRSTRSRSDGFGCSNPATISVKRTILAACRQRVSKRGQVAQG